MNSNPRGVQTPPRPQPQRQSPTRQPVRQPQHSLASVSTGFWVVFSATLLLLAAMIIALTVTLCIADEPSGANGPSGGGQSQVDNNHQEEPTPTPVRSTKTGISLPCATKAGTYVYDTSVAADMSGDPDIQSRAAALINVTEGKAVASKNGSAPIAPASMTKVMTVLLACEKATDPNALLTVTDEMVTKYASTGGGSVGVTEWKAGEQMTVEDALYLAIYQSDTYACWLLAEHIAGSEAAFAQMMTARARELGCSENTNFVNSTGLEDPNHKTTCFDLAAIMAAAMNNEAAYKILTSYDLYTFDLYVNGAKTRSISWYPAWCEERLKLYGYPQTAWYYAGNRSDIRILAGKTGYETSAGNCFVTAGQITDDSGALTGNIYVCVQAGAASPREATYDTRKIYQKHAKD